MVSPERKVELEFLPPAPAKSLDTSVIRSFISKFASIVTIAVITFVIDAIGRTALVFLLYNTSPVFASNTKAARALTVG